MKNIIIVAAVLAGIVSARADSGAGSETNTVLQVPKVPWVSTITAGLTLTRGNSDTALFTAKYLTQKKQALNEWTFGADAAYGQSAAVTTANSLHGYGQYNYLFTPKFYAYGNVDALHDDIQDLKYQVSVSPGAGYYFIKTLGTTLAGELGPGVVTELRGQERETYMSLRLAEHFEQKLSAGARLWEKAEIDPQVNKFDNYTVEAELGLESSITKRFSLQLVLDDDYANEPAEGREKNDVKIVSGISYKF